LLSSYSNDEELTNKINIIFNKLSNNFIINSENIEKQILQFKIKTYDGSDQMLLNNYKHIGSNKIVEIWKNMLILIVNVSTSSMIKNLKSIMPNTGGPYNIQKEYIDYLMKYTNGIISDKGLLNIIDKIELYFGNQLVDTVTSEMYMIYKTLFQNFSSISALNQFYGISDGVYYERGGGDYERGGGLRDYIIQFKNKDLYLPNYFYFKEYMNSIPLISCMYTDVSIRLYLQKESIIKSFYTPTLLGPGIGQFNEVSMLLDYVYVEKDERARLSRGTIDNLITIHKNYTSCKSLVGQEQGVEGARRLIRIRHDFSLTNLVKEIFWTNKFTITSTDNNLITSTDNNLITNELITNELITTNIDITDKVKILSTLIYVNGARRDGIDPVNEETINPIFQKSINPDYNAITTTINQYKYNTSAYGPNNVKGQGYNAYSFAFKPEDFQPSGAINMSQINTFSIELIIDPLQSQIPLAPTTAPTTVPTTASTLSTLSTLSMYTTGYNFIRYQGGIGAVLYTV
jgi:hypothetical protein